MKAKVTIKNLTQSYTPSEIEEEVLRYWKENKIFEKSIAQRPADNPYRFYDGPPFVTGLPHYGHLLGSIVKDVIPRFQTMKGKRVDRVWGWDCHGLPIENKVEKELGINSKKEIETLGVDKFVAACKKYVGSVSSEWEWYIDHIGRWVDFKDAYRTMDLNYMESVIWVFKQLHSKGQIYKGKRVSLFCPRCSTPISNFEVAMDNSYKDVTDPSVFVKFKQAQVADNVYFLAWTTTPWTLPTNFALGVSPDKAYVKVLVGAEHFILAEGRLTAVFGDNPYEIEEEFLGENLVGLRYEPLYQYYGSSIRDHVIYPADFVSMEDGTGIVHIAPGFGEDDTELGKKYDLSMVDSVDESGKLDPLITVAQNKFFKAADKLILEDLKNKGSIYKSTTLVHSYPHCHRCDTPLLYKSQVAWYINIQSIKEKLKETNEEINWVPKHFKHGRFELGIDSAPDWCISRSRYWGTPIPVWECECGEMIVPESVAEIEKLSGQKVTELHRPEIDQITFDCPKCGKKVHRVAEVLDSWVESASMPYAQVHYPFENKKKFQDSFPADFIVEYTGQLRAWFYVTHVISNLLFDSIAFKNVTVTGVIMGNDGRKMSKSLGNFPDPKGSIQKLGADALRLYLMGSPVVVGQDITVSEQDWANELKTTLMMLWNSYKYFVSYAGLENWETKAEYPQEPTALDKWILSRLYQMVNEVDSSLSDYQIPKSVASVKDFISDLSTWYIRRSRDRVGPSAENKIDKEIAYLTMYQVFSTLLKTIAPLTPFISEYLYQHLTGEESVHLTDWPADSSISEIDFELISDMDLVRKVCEIGHAERKKIAIPVKQTLASVEIIGKFTSLEDKDELIQLIKEELNVEKVSLVSGETNEAKFDTELTPHLKEKGTARELIRSIQEARKEAGCNLDEMIKLVLPSWPSAFEEEIKRKTLASSITVGPVLKITRAD